MLQTILKRTDVPGWGKEVELPLKKKVPLLDLEFVKSSI